MPVTTATTLKTLRFGMIVLYHGSMKTHYGQLFRISGTDTWEGERKYRLRSYFAQPGGRDDMMWVRRASITHIPASAIKTVKCRDCHLEYIAVPGHGINAGGCPLCALPKPPAL